MKKATYLLTFLVLGALFVKAQTSSVGTTITISKLIAYEKDDRFYIDWSTDGTNNSNYWEVQSSTDGKRFSTIALVLGPDPSKPGEQYGYKGKINNQKPAVYYRIVHVDTSGARQESNIIKLMKLGPAMSYINPDIKSRVPE